METIKNNIGQMLNKLCEGMYEREQEVKLALLASIAGESIFLLGPPGVAKSLIARRIKHAYKNAKSFEYLMGRFSTPDEIFGPISVSKLKEDKYERITSGYLPDSEIVFLDEIWKASPAIQNSLLTAINEKIFRNGIEDIKIKMKLLIAASNELPRKGEGLEALWDRFIIRLYVDNIKNKENFNKMITDTKNLYEDCISEELKITNEEYEKWQKDIDKVEVPPEVLEIIDVIRKMIVIRNENNKDKEPIYVSDRRWKKIVRILRSSAFLNGRNKVDIMDCFLIQYFIWNNIEEIEEVKNIIYEAIAKYGYRISIDTTPIKKEIEELKKEIEEKTKAEVEVKEKVPKVYFGKYYKIKDLYYSRYSQYNGYILILDYKKLSKYSEKEIEIYYLYDDGREYRNKCHNVKKTLTEHKIEIDNITYDIECGTKKRIEIKDVAPNKSTKQEWDEKIGEINEKLDSLILKISEYKKRDLEHAKTNLFVDSNLTNIAFKNLNTTSSEIAKLKVELEKLRDYYEQLK
jgi:MoxR-like ATPase